MNTAPYFVVGLGEVLWDLLPAGARLGGAPANFACAATQLGDRGALASRVGRDAEGFEALRRLRDRGLRVEWVQLDEARATGAARVSLGADGQPRFGIAEGAAWDFLEWTPEWESLAALSDAVCFGTLAQRRAPARETLRRFLRATRPEALRLFDANLRQTFYTADVLSESLSLCQVAKLSSEELRRVAGLLRLGGGGELARARRLIREFDVRLVAVTRGARGSLLVTGKGTFEHPGFKVQVRDAVGAGDAFTAALTYQYLRGAGLERMSEAANRLGAWVASQEGATPPLTDEIREQVSGL